MANTAAQRATAKAARIRTADAPAPSGIDGRAEAVEDASGLERAAAAARASRTVQTKPVRRTVDLPPARHHALTAWAQEEALRLGVARVYGQNVINELIHLLLTDETTSRKVHAALEAALVAEGK